MRKQKALFNKKPIKKKNLEISSSDSNYSNNSIRKYFQVSNILHSNTNSEMSINNNEKKVFQKYHQKSFLDSLKFPFFKNNKKEEKKNNINNNENENENNEINIYLKNKSEKTFLYNEKDLNDLCEIINKNIIKDLKTEFNDENFDDFLNNYFELIINKFLFNKFEHFIYVPSNLININYQNNFNNDIFFFKGCDSSKNIQLQYFPINLKEIELFFPNLTKKISHFLKKQNYNKSLVLYSKNYLNYLKILEIIFDNFDYQIIRLENESIKIMKLNKISEALKSERINSISDDFNKKLSILEFISTNDQMKFNNFLIGCNFNDSNSNNKENKKKIDDEIIDLSKEEKIFYPKTQIPTSKHTISILGKSQKTSNENNNLDNKIFNVIKQNIYNIFNNKKTLLLIVDSFDEDDDFNNNKNYFKEICNKINESKIPIILLTNNLNVFLNNQNNENFDIFKIENEEFENKENIIFYISNIIILHLYLNIENFNENIEKLKLKIKNYFLDSNLNYFLITHGIHKKIINLCEKIVYFKKFNFEEILFYLSDIFRKINSDKNIQKTEIFEKFKFLIEHDFENYINNSIEVDINSNNIDFDFNAIEKDSFNDCYLKNNNNNNNNLNFKQRLKEDKNFYQKYLKNHLILHKKEIININQFFQMIYKLKEKNIINFLGVRNKKSYNKINLIQKFFKNINQNQLKRFFLNHDENKIIKKIDCYEFIIENLAYDYYFDYILIDQINDDLNNNNNNKNIFCKMSKKRYKKNK